MTDVTPAMMLANYRRDPDQFVQDQVRLFRAMSTFDQRELLFFMTMHASMQVMRLEGLLMGGRPPHIKGLTQ